MKITIDTKEDSHTEIQKAIRLLQSLVEHKTSHSNIFEDDSPSLPTTDTNQSSQGGLFNMFGNDSTPPPEPPVVEPKLRNLNDEESEEKTESFEMMEY